MNNLQKRLNAITGLEEICAEGQISVISINVVEENGQYFQIKTVHSKINIGEKNIYKKLIDFQSYLEFNSKWR